MPTMTIPDLTAAVRQAARPLRGTREDYDALMDLIGDAHYVLIGEASHGTHEFYRERARITRRLVEDKGFCAVAVEADWPDAYRVNRYVRGLDGDSEGSEALGDFKRFPTWMWRNADVLEFVEWLRAHNDAQDDAAKVGFYGLDLYSLHASAEAVIQYLERVDPEAAVRARFRYGCFDNANEDPQAYGYAASFGLSKTCEDEAVKQLAELQQRAASYLGRDGRTAAEDLFYAEQNARLVKNAERYYRSMFGGRVSSWNLRDQHMADTLEALMQHLADSVEDPKVVVWAHNSHIGDARATELGDQGELNIGQLMHEYHGSDAVSVGFSTYSGTVTAASDWGGAAECKHIRPGHPDSYETVFHNTGIPGFLLTLRDSGRAAESLRWGLLERAIGVIYLPETERISHYFYARLPDQFDAIIHIDETNAVRPLETMAEEEVSELEEETFPSGM